MQKDAEERQTATKKRSGESFDTDKTPKSNGSPKGMPGNSKKNRRDERIKNVYRGNERNKLGRWRFCLLLRRIP